MNTPATTTMTALQGNAMPSSAPLSVQQQSRHVSAGFFDLQSFELMQRVAKAFAASDLVPQQYRGNLANTMIALDMAQRIGANPLMTMQNLYVVQGAPGWSSKFLIATVNASGRYSSLRYEWRGEPGADNYGCRAWAVEKATGERLDGIWVDWKMVKAEEWNSKKGSKWKTMPDQMFVYRASAFWVRAYAPELAMGLQTSEELVDVVDVADDGRVTVTTESLRAHAPAQRVDQETGEIQQEAPKRQRKPRQAEAQEPVQDAVEVTEQQEAPQDRDPAVKQQSNSQPEQDLLGDVPEITWAQVVGQINTARDKDELDAARDLIKHVPGDNLQAELHQKAAQRLKFLQGEQA